MLNNTAAGTTFSASAANGFVGMNNSRMSNCVGASSMLLEKKRPACQSGNANGKISSRMAISSQSPQSTVVVATASRRHVAPVRRPRLRSREATMYGNTVICSSPT